MRRRKSAAHGNLRLDECDYVCRNLRCVYVEADRLARLKLEGEGACSVRAIRISVIVRLIVIVGLRSVIGLGSDASRIELVCVNEANAERKVEDILTGSLSGEGNLVGPLVCLSNLNSELVGLKHKVFLCYGTCDDMQSCSISVRFRVSPFHRAVAQLAECASDKREVVGSSPTGPT